MALSREVEYWRDFRGGLNLTENTQALRRDESPDAVNVDFGLRGGFTLRGGFQTKANSLNLVGARFIGVDDRVYIQGGDGSLLEYDGATLDDTTEDVTDDNDERVRMARFRTSDVDSVYFANGRSSSNIIMQKWVPGTTTLSTLTNTFNDDYLVPTTGNMPLARFIAANNGFMWVADTVESGTRYPARVRFSHEQNVESWATDDWFNVGEPGADDPITSLVPFNDQLLIFKRSSVWAVFGYDRDTFLLERITGASGTCTCGAVAVNSGVCYWFSTDGQLMAYNGDGVAMLSEPIDYWSQIGKIQHGGGHRLMWSDGRLWLSLEAGIDEDVDRWLFLWHPQIKAFTRYDREVTDLVHWSKFGSDGDPLFLQNLDYQLYRFDQNYEVDTDAVAGNVPIEARFRTAWMTADETATRKRWKRPRVTAAATSTATIIVRIYLNFDDRNYTRQMQFTVDVPTTDSLWGTFDWGDPWSVAADEYYEFERLASAGTGYSVSFEFSSTDNLGRWWVDSIAVPFRRKEVR